MEPPELPDPGDRRDHAVRASAASPARAAASDEPAPSRPKEHDLVGLETSGYLDRLGFDVPEATYEQPLPRAATGSAAPRSK